MSKRFKNGAAATTALGALMCLMVLFAAPALAEKPEAAEKGTETAEAAKDNSSSKSPSASKSSSDHSQGNASTTGDVTEPQPASEADFSGNGANDHGPYDSTRDGSPSENGNGGGEAKGKPCAGCVGKADNKNPPGQAPGGSDANNGYECDGNSGVGKTNPAHTGCTEPPEEPECDEQVEDCGGTPPPGGDDDDVDGDTDNKTPPEDDDVLGERFHRGSPPAVGGKIIPKAVAGAALPFTGAGSVVMYFALGMILMLSGGLLWRLNRN